MLTQKDEIKKRCGGRILLGVDKQIWDFVCEAYLSFDIRAHSLCSLQAGIISSFDLMDADILPPLSGTCVPAPGDL